MINLKQFLFLLFVQSFCLFFLSCHQPDLVLPDHFYSTAETEEKLKSIKQTLEKEPACQTKEENPNQVCWTLPHCRSFCANLFINKNDIQKCHNWPLELADSFSDLYETMKDGVFQDLNVKTFKCFLKLTDNNPILFKDLNEEESKEFLLEIAGNPNLAYQLSSVDKGDFSFLIALFRKLSGKRINSVKEPLGFKADNFLIEIYKGDNHPAWIWLNDYLVARCKRDSKCTEPLEYYCEILKNVKRRTLEDFFENSSPFQRGYEKPIQRKSCGTSHCEYGNLQDFQQMCDNL